MPYKYGVTVTVCVICWGIFICILVKFSINWEHSFNETSIPLLLVGYEIIIAN